MNNKNIEKTKTYQVVTLPSNVQSITKLLNDYADTGWTVKTLTDHMVLFEK